MSHLEKFRSYHSRYNQLDTEIRSGTITTQQANSALIDLTFNSLNTLRECILSQQKQAAPVTSSATTPVRGQGILNVALFNHLINEDNFTWSINKKVPNVTNDEIVSLGNITLSLPIGHYLDHKVNMNVSGTFTVSQLLGIVHSFYHNNLVQGDLDNLKDDDYSHLTTNTKRYVSLEGKLFFEGFSYEGFGVYELILGS